MKTKQKIVMTGLMITLIVSASLNGLFIVFIAQKNKSDLQDNGTSWEDRCRGLDYSDWLYAIKNILPLVKEVDEVKDLVNDSNKYSLLTKLDPWEINDMIDEYPGIYEPLFGLNETDDIWWMISYSLSNSPVWTHNLYVYINNRNHQCVTRTMSAA